MEWRYNVAWPPHKRRDIMDDMVWFCLHGTVAYPGRRQICDFQQLEEILYGIERT
jgi:hypothetical protein